MELSNDIPTELAECVAEACEYAFAITFRQSKRGEVLRYGFQVQR